MATVIKARPTKMTNKRLCRAAQTDLYCVSVLSVVGSLASLVY